MGGVIDMTERRARIEERRNKDGRSHGDILIARRIFESAAVKGRPGNEGMLWIRIISEARFTDGPQLKRGQLFTNAKQICRWISYKGEGRSPGWTADVRWIERTFARWRKLEMIETEKCRRGVIITIKKYDFYQARRWSDYSGQRGSESEGQRASEITRENNDLGDIPSTERSTTSITIDATTVIRPKNDPKSGENERQRGSEIEKNESNLEDIHGTAAPTTGIRKIDSKVNESPKNGKVEIVNDVNGLVDQSKVRGSQLMDNEPESLPKKKSNQKTTSITYIIEKNEVKRLKTTEEESAGAREIPEAKNPGNLPAVIEPEILTPVKTSTSKKKPVPVDEILEIFLSTCPSLPRARMTKNLRDQISARWNEDVEYRSLNFWRGYFRDWVATSEFLNGESSSGFRASIHWLTGPKNMAKVLAGNYVNRVCRAPQARTIADCRYLEKKKLEAYEREVRERNQRRDEQRGRDDGQILIERGGQDGYESRENGSGYD